MGCLALTVGTSGCGEDGPSSAGASGAGAFGGADATTGGAQSSGGTAGGSGGSSGSSPGGEGASGGVLGGSGGTGAAGGAAGVAGSGGAGAGAGAGAGGGGAPTEPPVTWPLVNGVQWADTEGEPIQAHGGGVLRVGEYYYWFGENRNPNGTFFAVSAYRSRDLRRWEFRNDVLKMTSDSGLNPANVERPKVVFNESTGKYVMWMHWENGSDYGEARAAVASADTVDGDYEYHGSFRPLAGSGVTDHGKPGYMSRDCTLFVDDDRKAYFLSASNENYDLNLYELTPNYLAIERLVAVLFEGGHREAPALFKREGRYFLITSGATGWDPNQAKYATSTSLASGWSSMQNVADDTTFHSQSTFVLPVAGTRGTSFLYLGDRWAGAWGGRVNDSTYVWQPITFPSDTTLSMTWNNTLDLDAAGGSVTGAVRAFQLVNVRSGLALDVENGSSENGAAVLQRTPAASLTQQWRLSYDGAGYFQLTNVGSGKVLDVPDESTDGVELAQWEDHDGANQAWLVVDRGSGRYGLRNKNSTKWVGVTGGSLQEGAAAEQRAETTGDEQRWRLVPVE